MRTNVEKVLERDQKLSQLDDRAGKKYNGIISFGRRFAGGCFTVRSERREAEAKILDEEYQAHDYPWHSCLHHPGRDN
ncbi:hypothetical protein X801_08897, partial [Opisthorchis viverrini]